MQTRDTHYAAFLIARGYRLVDTDMRGTKMYFIFEDALRMPSIMTYIADTECNVNAKRYSEAIRYLNTLTKANYPKY